MSGSCEPTRPSRRAQTMAIATRLTLRPVSLAIPANRIGIAASRQIVARSMAAFGPPLRHTRVEFVDVATAGGPVRGEWVRAPGVHRTDAVLFYIHGSGYALCSAKTHRGLTSRLSALTGLPVFSVDYRLAPQHVFPAAADDVERAFGWVTDTFCSAERIVVAGDSAGGHLVVDLSLARLRADLPRPAAQVLLSPLWDATLGLAAQREQIRTDPMTSAATARRLVGLYTSGTDLAHARLAHVVAGHEALPPTLIQAGGAEMLAADAHALHRALLASGTPCELEVWPGQMHVFQALPRAVPEATVALRRAASFLSAAVPAAADATVSRPSAHAWKNRAGRRPARRLHSVKEQTA